MGGHGPERGPAPRADAHGLRTAGRPAGGQGPTNKEAATELYVSVKTVEHHLSNIYMKLGVRSRRELARALETPRHRPAAARTLGSGDLPSVRGARGLKDAHRCHPDRGRRERARAGASNGPGRN